MADRNARRQEIVRLIIERLRWDGNAAAQAGDWDKLARTAQELLNHIPDDPEALEWLEQVTMAEEVERDLMRRAAQTNARKARGQRAGFGRRALWMIVIAVALGGVIFLLAHDQILSVANGLLSSPASPTASMPAFTATYTPTKAPAATDTPAPIAPAPTPTADEPFAVVDASHGARLLAEPSAGADIVTLVDHNEMVTLLAIGEDRDWLYVHTELGQKGWVPASSLMLDEAELDALPVRERARSTSTPAPTYTPSGTPRPTNTPTTKSQAVPATSTPAPTSTVPPTSTMAPTSTTAPTATDTPTSMPTATFTPVPLPPPLLIAPGNWAEIEHTTPTFEWTSAGNNNVSRYIVTIDEGTPGERTITVYELVYTVQDPLPEGCHTWKITVVASENESATAQSETWTFCIRPKSGEPEPPEDPPEDEPPEDPV